MGTLTTKLGAELTVGDSIIALDAPRLIIATIPEQDYVDVTLQGGIALRIDLDSEVEVEHVQPGPYDGYMSEVLGGAWHVTSAGNDIGVFYDEAAAATALAATSKRPTWKVTVDGATTRLG